MDTDFLQPEPIDPPLRRRIFVDQETFEIIGGEIQNADGGLMCVGPDQIPADVLENPEYFDEFVFIDHASDVVSHYTEITEIDVPANLVPPQLGEPKMACRQAEDGEGGEACSLDLGAGECFALVGDGERVPIDIPLENMADGMANSLPGLIPNPLEDVEPPPAYARYRRAAMAEDRSDMDGPIYSSDSPRSYGDYSAAYYSRAARSEGDYSQGSGSGRMCYESGTALYGRGEEAPVAAFMAAEPFAGGKAAGFSASGGVAPSDELPPDTHSGASKKGTARSAASKAASDNAASAIAASSAGDKARQDRGAGRGEKAAERPGERAKNGPRWVEKDAVGDPNDPLFIAEATSGHGGPGAAMAAAGIAHKDSGAVAHEYVASNREFRGKIGATTNHGERHGGESPKQEDEESLDT